MKKIYLALTAFLLLAFNALSAKDYKTINKDGYEISYPASWNVLNLKADESTSLVVQSTKAYPADDYFENFSVFITPAKNSSLKEMVSTEKALYVRFDKSFKLISEKSGISNGLHYEQYTHISAPTNFDVLYIKRYYKKDNKFYNIQFVANAKKPNEFKEEYLKILNSFKFK